MPSFFDDLEAQLRAAARARTASRRRGPTWLRSGARAAPVIAAVATTAAVAIAALLLVGHGRRPAGSPAGSSPPSGPVLASSPQVRREMAYIELAARQVAKIKVCRPHPSTATRMVSGTPSRQLLSMLGVLRRRPTPADHLSAQSLSGLATVYSRFVRRALVERGTSYYVIPGRADRAAQTPPAGCIALESSALRYLLPRIPVRLRAPTLKLQARLVAFELSVIKRASGDTICVATVARNSGSQECGLGAADIKNGIAPSNDNGTFSSVVPDGVSAVALRVVRPDGSTVTVTARVSGNIYALHVPHLGRYRRVTLIWRSRTAILKTFAQPNAAAMARYCRRHISCIALAGVTASGSSGVSEASSSSSSTPAPASPHTSGSGGG